MMTASAFGRVSSRFVEVLGRSDSGAFGWAVLVRVGGAKCGGPTRVIWAPRAVRIAVVERATLEEMMSPTMAMCFPVKLKVVGFVGWLVFVLRLMRSRDSASVRASMRAWVGCSCLPSPALMIGACAIRSAIAGAPASLWRMTMRSGRMASVVLMVSASVSPLLMLEPAVVRSAVVAPSRCAAIVKLRRVLVESSKKRFAMMRPVSGRLSGKLMAASAALARSARMFSGVSWLMPRSEVGLGWRSWCSWFFIGGGLDGGLGQGAPMPWGFVRAGWIEAVVGGVLVCGFVSCLVSCLVSVFCLSADGYVIRPW